MGQKAFITGVSGFTGRELANELRRNGFEVYGISKLQEVSSDSRTFCCDLNDRERMVRLLADIKPEFIFHLAAISFVAHHDSREIYETNLLGTLNLLQSIADAKINLQKLVIASSGTIYGNVEADQIDETAICNPINDYGVSKLAMEHMVKLWFPILPTIITRPFNCIGHGQARHFLVSKIVSHFVMKSPFIELGNLNVVRDFIDIRTTAECYVKLATSPVTGEVVNICSSIGHSLSDVLSTMEGIAGHPIEVRINSSYVRPNEIRRLVGSNAKLKRTIGQVNEYPLGESLSAMYSELSTK